MRRPRFILTLALTVFASVLAAGCHSSTPQTSTPATAPAAAPVAMARGGPPGCFAFDSAYFEVFIVDTVAFAQRGVTPRHVTSHIVELSDSALYPGASVHRGLLAQHRRADIPTLGVLPATAVRTDDESHWYPRADGSVYFWWRISTAGPLFLLDVRGDSLVGTRHSTSDRIITPESPRDPPSWPAVAVRVPCPRPDSAP